MLITTHGPLTKYAFGTGVVGAASNPPTGGVAQTKKALSAFSHRAAIAALLVIFLVSGFQNSRAGASEAEKLAFVGGTIVPAIGDDVILDGILLVEGGLIKKVGKAADIEIPAGFRQIDVSGKWLTPGLIDSNAHLILTTVPEFFIKYEDRLEDVALQSAQVALKYGMTTIGDTWGPLEPLLKVRDRINNGDEIGTRVLVAGNIIGTGGPFSAYFMGGWDMRGDSIRYGGWVHPSIQRRIDTLWEAGVGPNLLAMTPEEVGEALRAYIARGVDFIKVGVSGHGLGAVEPLMFSQETLEIMRQEARRANIPFTTHTFTIASTDAAIKVDTDFLVHPNVMSVPYAFATEKQQKAIRDLAAETARKGIYAGLMAIPSKEQNEIYANWDPKTDSKDFYINKIMVNRGMFASAEAYKKRVAGLKIWLDAGVKYTIATDSGPEAADLGPTIWGRIGRVHFERMEAFQQLGEPPYRILQASTINGAAAYGMADKLGTLEDGKIADILVVDGNPLIDIKNLRKIHMVIKDGRVIDREGLPTVKVLDYDPEAKWPH